MDDFINKVGWGLNLVFSNGVGWPRTDWLITRGARREHAVQVLPAAASAADPGLVQGLPGRHAHRPDAQRSASARGWSVPAMSDEQALAWLRLL